MREPTYSQIDAAVKAFGCDHSDTRRERMKLALMAAQKVDRNIYGDMHFGGGADGVHFMCDSKADRDKIMDWNHAATSTLPYHEKHTIPELKQRREQVTALTSALQDTRREHTNDIYMLAAVVQMLGPLGRKVWKTWKDRGVVRQHTSWNPEFLARASGEEVAQAHLDMFEAEKTAVRIDNIDSHLGGIDVVS